MFTPLVCLTNTVSYALIWLFLFLVPHSFFVMLSSIPWLVCLTLVQWSLVFCCFSREYSTNELWRTWMLQNKCATWLIHVLSGFQISSFHLLTSSSCLAAPVNTITRWTIGFYGIICHLLKDTSFLIIASVTPEKSILVWVMVGFLCLSFCLGMTLSIWTLYVPLQTELKVGVIGRQLENTLGHTQNNGQFDNNPSNSSMSVSLPATTRMVVMSNQVQQQPHQQQQQHPQQQQQQQQIADNYVYVKQDLKSNSSQLELSPSIHHLYRQVVVQPAVQPTLNFLHSPFYISQSQQEEKIV